MKNTTHKAKKKFGQNFLKDQYIIQQIISYINPSNDYSNIEIGPGLGAITKPILENIDQLHAIEIDAAVIPTIENPKLIIHNQDVLNFDFNTIINPSKRAKIFGNLPYNIATAIIIKMIDYRQHIHSMCFMVQKEVAEKICNTSKKNSRLSLILQYYFNIHYVLEVPPEAFDPQPKVNSAVLYLTTKANKDDSCKDMQLFETITKQAFSMQRKTIKNNLKKMISAAELVELGIDPVSRPETISIRNYINLTNYLYKKDHNE